MDYTELIALVRDTLKDTQVDDNQVRSFITLAESKLNRDLLSTQYGEGSPRQLLEQVTGQTDAESRLTVPTDFSKEKSVKINGVLCRYVSTDVVISTDGFGDSDYELTYYKKLACLDMQQSTNWLLTCAPDAYLYATCLQYIPWGQAIENLPLWEQFYSDAIRTVKQTAQPRGGGVFASMRGRPYSGTYTKVGDFIIFGSTSRMAVV